MLKNLLNIKFLFFSFFYLILWFFSVIVSLLSFLSTIHLFEGREQFYFLNYLFFIILFFQVTMYFNFDKNDKFLPTCKIDKIMFCFVFFLGANSFIRILFKKSFYKKECVFINNKIHIIKTNILGDKYYFYKNNIHREDYRPAVISRNLNYWKNHTYVHGKKISESEKLTKIELNQILNQINKEKIQDKILNF